MEELSQKLLSATSDLVVITDLDGLVKYINEAGSKINGFNISEIINRNIMDFVADEQKNLVIPGLSGSADFNHSPIELLLKCDNSDMQIPFISLRNTLYDENKNPYGYVFFCMDMLKIRQDEINRKQKSGLLNKVSEAVNTLLVERDFEKSINKTLKILGESTAANSVYICKNHADPGTQELLLSMVFKWSDIINGSDLDINVWQNLRYSVFLEKYFTVLSNNGIVSGNDCDLMPKLKEFLASQGILSILIVPIMVREDFWGFIGFNDHTNERIWTDADISVIKPAASGIGGAIDRENTRKELEEAYKKAEESDRLKSSLLANMSHEFRTPMTGILGFAEMIFNESESSDIKHMGSYILDSAKRLMNTLDAMIKISEIESGLSSSDQNKEKVEINSLILSCVSDFVMKAARKNITIEYKKQEPLFVIIDKGYTKQILNHLIDNALKFTQRGSVVLKAGIQIYKDREHVCFEVIDTGIGIPKEFHQVIFKEFRQVSEGLNRLHEGSGLGLSIASKLAHLLNGHISLESEVGKGSTFKVFLPFEECSQIDSLDSPLTKHFPQQNARLTMEQERKLPEILLVEDNDVNIQLVMAYLRGIFHVDFATNGFKAIQMTKVHNYRMILMDINLGPGIDGLETTQEIRKNPAYKSTPVVAVTGFTLSGERDRLIEGGCTHYIAKPFEKNTLVNLCTKILLE